MNANVLIALFLLVVMFMSAPLLLQYYVRSKTKGKHLCAIIGIDKPLTFKLLKVYKDQFVRDREDEWILSTKQIKLVAYPIGWPSILSAFQQIMPCSLYMRGRSEPLDWEDPTRGAMSSKELPVVLDPHWLINLVKGVGEDGKTDKNSRLMAMIAIGVGILSLLMIIYLITKVGGIEQAVQSLVK